MTIFNNLREIWGNSSILYDQKYNKVFQDAFKNSAYDVQEINLDNDSQASQASSLRPLAQRVKLLFQQIGLTLLNTFAFNRMSSAFKKVHEAQQKVHHQASTANTFALPVIHADSNSNPNSSSILPETQPNLPPENPLEEKLRNLKETIKSEREKIASLEKELGELTSQKNTLQTSVEQTKKPVQDCKDKLTEIRDNIQQYKNADQDLTTVSDLQKKIDENLLAIDELPVTDMAEKVDHLSKKFKKKFDPLNIIPKPIHREKTKQVLATKQKLITENQNLEQEIAAIQATFKTSPNHTIALDGLTRAEIINQLQDLGTLEANTLKRMNDTLEVQKELLDNLESMNKKFEPLSSQLQEIRDSIKKNEAELKALDPSELDEKVNEEVIPNNSTEEQSSIPREEIKVEVGQMNNEPQKIETPKEQFLAKFAEVSPELSDILKDTFAKFPQSEITSWSFSPETGKFTMSLSEPMRLWVPASDANGKPPKETPCGAVMLFGVDEKGNAINKIHGTINKADHLIQFQEGISNYSYAKLTYSRASVIKMKATEGKVITEIELDKPFMFEGVIRKALPQGSTVEFKTVGKINRMAITKSDSIDKMRYDWITHSEVIHDEVAAMKNDNLMNNFASKVK